ncbi:hypothetical protein ACFYWS_30705 [Streptomyces sp. NPDC002795]|uniref:hypothetical protein n=1 Tax=Streptomyces sp. NPDC002795 TaxID=3364665 RepID=UPI0036AC419D
MLDLTRSTLPYGSLLLAAVALLVSLARMTFPAPGGRHRRPAAADVVRRPEPPLDGSAHRLVRPYVVAAEQAARRRELLLADFGVDGSGPYVIHGVEVA